MMIEDTITVCSKLNCLFLTPATFTLLIFWQNLYVGRLIDLGPDGDPAAEDYIFKRKNVD